MLTIVLVPQLRLSQRHVTELLPRQLVAPVAEGSLGELLDVALVYESDALAPLIKGVLDGLADQALGAELADGLDADAGTRLEVGAHLLLQEPLDPICLGCAGLVFDAGVDVLGVLAEDHHIHQLGTLHNAGDAWIPPHGTHASIEVQHPAQGDVEATEPTTYRRGEGAFDTDDVLAQRLDRLLGHIGAVDAVGLLASVDLHPVDLAPALVDLLHGGI